MIRMYSSVFKYSCIPYYYALIFSGYFIRYSMMCMKIMDCIETIVPIIMIFNEIIH